MMLCPKRSVNKQQLAGSDVVVAPVVTVVSSLLNSLLGGLLSTVTNLLITLPITSTIFTANRSLLLSLLSDALGTNDITLNVKSSTLNSVDLEAIVNGALAVPTDLLQSVLENFLGILNTVLSVTLNITGLLLADFNLWKPLLTLLVSQAAGCPLAAVQITASGTGTLRIIIKVLGVSVDLRASVLSAANHFKSIVLADAYIFNVNLGVSLTRFNTNKATFIAMVAIMFGLDEACIIAQATANGTAAVTVKVTIRSIIPLTCPVTVLSTVLNTVVANFLLVLGTAKVTLTATLNVGLSLFLLFKKVFIKLIAQKCNVLPCQVGVTVTVSSTTTVTVSVKIFAAGTVVFTQTSLNAIVATLVGLITNSLAVTSSLTLGSGCTPALIHQHQWMLLNLLSIQLDIPLGAITLLLNEVTGTVSSLVVQVLGVVTGLLTTTLLDGLLVDWLSWINGLQLLNGLPVLDLIGDLTGLLNGGLLNGGLVGSLTGGLLSGGLGGLLTGLTGNLLGGLPLLGVLNGLPLDQLLGGLLGGANGGLLGGLLGGL